MDRGAERQLSNTGGGDVKEIRLDQRKVHLVREGTLWPEPANPAHPLNKLLGNAGGGKDRWKGKNERLNKRGRIT